MPHAKKISDIKKMNKVTCRYIPVFAWVALVSQNW